MAGMVRNQFTDLNFDDALPALMQIIQDNYEQFPSVAEAIYNIKKTNRSIEQSTQISGFGNFVETNEKQEHASDLAYQTYDKTYRPLKYTLGFSMSRELVDDDQFGIVAGFSRSLGRSAYNTKEIHGAEVFNDAFDGTTFTGGDGRPLCDTAHTSLAGSLRNELSTSADLSVASLKQAFIDMQDTVDHRGKLLNIMPRTLLVPSELRFTALELLKSTQLADTANNNINSLDSLSLQPVVWNYLTDPDAWFLLADKLEHDLCWIERDPFEVITYDKPSTESKVVYGRMRYARGFNDWRGVFGSPGA